MWNSICNSRGGKTQTSEQNVEKAEEHDEDPALAVSSASIRSAPREVTAGQAHPQEPLAAQCGWALGPREALPPLTYPGSPSTFPCLLAPGHLYFEMFTRVGKYFPLISSRKSFLRVIGCSEQSSFENPHFLRRASPFRKWSVCSHCPTVQFSRSPVTLERKEQAWRGLLGYGVP